MSNCPTLFDCIKFFIGTKTVQWSLLMFLGLIFMRVLP